MTGHLAQHVLLAVERLIMKIDGHFHLRPLHRFRDALRQCSIYLAFLLMQPLNLQCGIQIFTHGFTIRHLFQYGTGRFNTAVFRTRFQQHIDDLVAVASIALRPQLQKFLDPLIGIVSDFFRFQLFLGSISLGSIGLVLVVALLFTKGARFCHICNLPKTQLIDLLS